MSSLALVLFAVFMAYVTVGAVAMRLWSRRRGPLRSANLYAAPDAWLAYWLPALIFTEVWALGGVGLMSFLLSITSPLLRSAGGAIYKLTFVIGIVGFAVLFAAFDVVLALRTRQVARRQQAESQAGHLNGSSSH